MSASIYLIVHQMTPMQFFFQLYIVSACRNVRRLTVTAPCQHSPSIGTHTERPVLQFSECFLQLRLTVHQIEVVKGHQPLEYEVYMEKLIYLEKLQELATMNSRTTALLCATLSVPVEIAAGMGLSVPVVVNKISKGQGPAKPSIFHPSADFVTLKQHAPLVTGTRDIFFSISEASPDLKKNISCLVGCHPQTSVLNHQ